MIVKKIMTSPKWIGENWKTITSMIAAIWTTVMFLSGWFAGVNATVKEMPLVTTRVNILEGNFKSYNSRFETFLEMYKLEVLGRKSEAQELARKLPDTNP